MKDLYKPGGSGKDWVILDEDDYNDYNDILEAQKETGKYSGYIELDNPLSASEPPELSILLAGMDIRIKIPLIQLPRFRHKRIANYMLRLMGKLLFQKRSFERRYRN